MIYARVHYLLIDEAHTFKNKEFTSHVQGVGGEGSKRATDLDLKLAYLRERHGERVATFATATPIANSIAEMWVMQSYLQPGQLERAGVASFDGWAATFGRSVTALELAPDGGSYRLNTRFARFANVPELLTMFRATADVRGAKDLALAIPRMRGGKAETVIVPASEALSEYVQDLVCRAEAVRDRRVTPDEDNMLKVAGDGRKAALDLRLVGREPDPAGGKIAAVASRVAGIYAETRERVYTAPTGETSPRTGALQVVFCDLGTPHPGAWSVYEELRRQLVARGVPEAQVTFVHEAGDDRAKAELFAACRDGRVAVLIGSTEKMGVGTNVQRRLVALHHLDCPWRPADIAQREGRALRQGNQNEEVAIYRYATEGSFDVYMWQTVERKAAFIHQVMAGEVAGRELEDIGEVALSYAEVKALATGNPLILEKAGVDNEVARLMRLRQAHGKDQSLLRRSADAAQGEIPRIEAKIAQADQAIRRRIDTAGERFAMQVGSDEYRRRVDAGAHLIHVLRSESKLAPEASPAQPHPVARLGGFDVTIKPTGVPGCGARIVIAIGGTPLEQLSVDAAEINQLDPAGLITRLENKTRGLEHTREAFAARLARLRTELGAAQSRIGLRFDQQGRLDKLRRRQAEIEAALIPAVSGEAAQCEPGEGSVVPSGSYRHEGSRGLAPLGPHTQRPPQPAPEFRSPGLER